MVKYEVLRNLYHVEKTIGSGGFAKVKLATHLLTGEKVAIKIMDKNVIGEGCCRVRMELEALKTISHHYICKLYQVIETDDHFFLVMEYCSGGELFDHIVEKSQLSEFEARIFFRQILSAVAYLHKLGYAHRDLKPENILLDKDMNIKLIDFGLCAKPKGGMSSHLETSCGSPTYAAPELIKGHSYLGGSVDVWSLGVLLYALLCGRLPFDSDNIEALYKKILSGKYSEPSCLSEGSKRIIREMLQTEPRRRISVEGLLGHDWVTMGCLEAVTSDSLSKENEKNLDVLKVLASYYMMDPEDMWERLSEWRYDYDTASYLLLLGRRREGGPLRLFGREARQVRRRLKGVPPLMEGLLKTGSSPPCLSTPPPPARQTYVLLKAASNDDKENTSQVPAEEGSQSPSSRLKRKRCHNEDLQSPVPVKMTPIKRSRIQPPVFTESPLTPPNSATPGRRGLISSLERRLHQVRRAITPAKKKPQQSLQPNVFSSKSLCNVSATSFKNPEQAVEELEKALTVAGMECKRKGRYLIKGKKILEKTKSTKLSFELEVCYVEGSRTASSPGPLIGVRRKRLNGDAWYYKQLCEQILKLTPSESL